MQVNSSDVLRIITAYADIHDPEYISKQMNDDEFLEWCLQGTTQDLLHTRTAFEKAGLYERAEIINSIYNQKRP